VQGFSGDLVGAAGDSGHQAKDFASLGNPQDQRLSGTGANG
jgi:hypothetical protein